MAAIFGLAPLITFSPLGRLIALHLPVWALVASQGFRLPLELAMHVMYERGVMPEQMSYSGRNFDIVTGASAIVVTVLVAIGRAGRRLVAGWNVLGFALLVNIIVIAMFRLRDSSTSARTALTSGSRTRRSSGYPPSWCWPRRRGFCWSSEHSWPNAKDFTRVALPVGVASFRQSGQDGY